MTAQNREDGVQKREDEVQKMVLHLLSNGMTPDDLVLALEERVSSRTIYRWARGESTPQNKSDLVRLEEVYAGTIPF